MSSHHFVKDKQEPALIIESLATFGMEYLGQLLEWNPLVICASKAYSELEERQIKADVLSSDFEKMPIFQNDVKEVDYPHSFIDAALAYLIHEKYDAVNIITESAFYKQKLLVYAPLLNLIVYCGQRRSFAVRSGFSKWKPAHSVIQMQDLSTLQVEGLEKIGPGQYITEQDGFYRVEFDQDYIFITEEI